MAKIITVASGKGGVGKTTITTMLAGQLAALRPERVALVDLDPNNNATDATLRRTPIEKIVARNTLHLLLGRANLAEVLQPSDAIPGLMVAPSIPALAKVGKELADNPAVYLKIPHALRAIDYLDYIVIDTPPALVLELRVALYAAHLVLVPVAASRWNVQGFDLIREEVDEVYEATGKRPAMLAVPSLVSTARADLLREGLADVPFTRTAIPRMASLEKLGNEAKLPKVDSPAAVLFAELAREVL